MSGLRAQRTARASTSTPAAPLWSALFDALLVMDLIDEQTHAEGKELLVRVLSMLSKMC